MKANHFGIFFSIAILVIFLGITVFMQQQQDNPIGQEKPGLPKGGPAVPAPVPTVNFVNWFPWPVCTYFEIDGPAQYNGWGHVDYKSTKTLILNWNQTVPNPAGGPAIWSRQIINVTDSGNGSGILNMTDQMTGTTTIKQPVTITKNGQKVTVTWTPPPPGGEIIVEPPAGDPNPNEIDADVKDSGGTSRDHDLNKLPPGQRPPPH